MYEQKGDILFGTDCTWFGCVCVCVRMCVIKRIFLPDRLVDCALNSETFNVKRSQFETQFQKRNVSTFRIFLHTVFFLLLPLLILLHIKKHEFFMSPPLKFVIARI